MNQRIFEPQRRPVAQAFTPVRPGFLQRTCACGGTPGLDGECVECRRKQLALQRRALQQAEPSSVPPVVHEVLRSPGQPLDPATRAFMEPRFGHDFGRVRVHTDAKAVQSAKAVNAAAYTVGRDVVFGTGRYMPETAAGERLLAHELAHVIQQGNGVSSTRGGLDISNSEDPAELEAERASRVVSAGESFAATPRGGLVLARQIPDGGVPAGTGPGSGLPAAATPDAGSADAGAPVPPNLTISRQGGTGQTFISTEPITLAVQVTGPANAAALAGQTSWTVHGVSANSGNGNPHTAANTSTFTFTPNPTNRPTTGSRAPNDPIQYRVEASVAGATAALDLAQDETDIMRQEYIDLGPAGTTPPARAEFVIPSIPGFNVGNYSLIVDGGMNNALTNTETHFQTLTQQVATPGVAPGAAPAPPGGPGAAPAAPGGSAAPAPPVPVPAISVSSGYRNPRRNVAAKSNFPVTSRHVLGRALDLDVAGANATLWARLRQAGANAGNTSICEHDANQVPCNDPTVNHVHIQW